MGIPTRRCADRSATRRRMQTPVRGSTTTRWGETGTFVLIAQGEQTDTVELYRFNADGAITALPGK